MAGRMINGAAALADLVRAAGETETTGVHRVLPVLPELSGLLPGRGLRRGSTVAVAAGAAVAAGGQAAPVGGGTSLLLALLAEASRSGSWCAVVGVPTLGALAAAESGIVLDRLALVPDPGPDWPTVVAALIDGIDVVATAVPGGVSGSVAARLVARARQRGSVLVPFGPWSGADVTLRVVEGRWEGLGPGHGRLRRREVTILAEGRGAAARPKRITMWMPGRTTHPLTLPAAPALPAAPPGPPIPAAAPAPPDPAAALAPPAPPALFEVGGSVSDPSHPIDPGSPVSGRPVGFASSPPLPGSRPAGFGPPASVGRPVGFGSPGSPGSPGSSGWSVGFAPPGSAGWSAGAGAGRAGSGWPGAFPVVG